MCKLAVPLILKSLVTVTFPVKVLIPSLENIKLSTTAGNPVVICANPKNS